MRANRVNSVNRPDAVCLRNIREQSGAEGYSSGNIQLPSYPNTCGGCATVLLLGSNSTGCVTFTMVIVGGFTVECGACVLCVGPELTA